MSKSADHREVEWQLTAPDLGAVRRWLAAHPSADGWCIQARPTVELQDTYYDTADWRIFRSGFALRVRDAAGSAEATLKELHSASATHQDRRELTEPVIDSSEQALPQLAGLVGTRVHAVAGTHPLQRLFGVRTSRQRFELRRDDSTDAVGELALDEAVVSRPDGAPQTSLQRVEVEALTAESQDLEGFVDRLRRECTLLPAAQSKFAVGLISVGLAPPPLPRFGSDLANDTMRIHEVALVSLRRHLSGWIAHEPGARLGEDPEALHDLRIAGRRLDATLGLFAPFLPARWLQLRKRLKVLMQAFGAVRDLDIARVALTTFERELPDVDRSALASFKHHLDNEHARTRARMLRALDAPTTQRWLERLTHTLAQPSISRAHRVQPLAVVVLPDLVRARYRKYHKAAQRLSADSTAEDYHAVRGKLKKLRYTVEGISDLYGKPAEQFLRALRPLQNRLGEQQDAHVAQARLHLLASQPRAHFPAKTLFLMGRMAERQSAVGVHAREKVEKQIRQLHRPRWKRLRRKLDEMKEKAMEQQETRSDTQLPAPQLAIPTAPSV